MTMLKRALALAAVATLIAAPSAFAAHAGEYRATSPGNGKCHDVGNRSAEGDQNAKGHGRAADNENSTIAPFACED